MIWLIFVYNKIVNFIRWCLFCYCIPEHPYPSLVLNNIYEPIGLKDHYIYTQVVNGKYKVDLPPNLKMLNNLNEIIDDGYIKIYRTNYSLPYNSKYYLDVELEIINNGNVKLFIDRYNCNNKLLEDFSYYKVATNGYNSLYIETLLSDEIYYEHIGVYIESSQNNNTNNICNIKRVYLGYVPINNICV